MAKFKDVERFFRRIPDQPTFVKINENGEKTISSAAFKDQRGCSVDRQADRNCEEVRNQLYVRFYQTKASICAVADVSFKDCCDANALVKEEPLEDNPFHCEIHRSDTQAELSKGQLKKLAQNANVKFFT
ncbi:MAG: hypothetical protein K2N27_10315 [Ruminococcus sp.]|nr:hypothetical protein [Ruminococcus sp.]